MTKYVSSKVSRCRAYHVDPNCVLLKKDVKEATQTEIEFHELTPCERCVNGGVETNPDQNWDYQNV